MTKYYRLKKDLPTFKAGEEFYLSEDGDLISVEKEPLAAYSRQTLEKFPNILKDWFEEICTGFYLADSGEIIKYYDDEDPYYLNCRKSIGNDFKTEAEAKKYGEYLEALQTIKGDTKGFKPDWKNWGQIKYYVYYDNNDGCLRWGDACCSQIQGAVYFKTTEDLKESFKKHRKKWMIVLGVENEN